MRHYNGCQSSLTIQNRFAIFQRECEHVVSTVDAVQVLEYSENFGKIVNKLPFTLHDKWRNIVFDIKEHGVGSHTSV